MKVFSPLFIIAGLLLLSGCNEATKSTESTEIVLSTIEQKRSYALGVMVGERVLKQYGKIDYQFLQYGMTAQQQGKHPLMTLAESQQVLNDYQNAIEDEKFAEVRARGQEFLKSNTMVEGVTVTASGLQYTVLTASDGARPSASDTVTVHYRGTLIDGTEFDSSYSRGEPATFSLSQVIPGWTEGVQLMNLGSKYKFVVPYQLGYGERGAGQSIGPFETLIFEVELLEIK